MTKTQMRITNFLALTVVVALSIGCGGGSDTVNNTFVGSGVEPPGVVGTINGSAGPVASPNLQPIEGQLGSAPLGTNPKYNVQTAENVIITRPVSSTSSLDKGVSSDSVLWVSVTPHGADPIPGNVYPPFYEGDKVDLYIRYVVEPGLLTLDRTWIIEACGLNFTDTYTHPSAGTYEAILPFILPYGTASLQAVFTGVVSLPKVSSVIPTVGYEGLAQVEFEIEYVDVLPPVYHPSEYTADNGGPHACMPDWGSILVFPDLHVEATDKGVGAVVYVFDKSPNELNGDEVAVKYSGLSGATFDPTKDNGDGQQFPPLDPETGEQFLISDCTIVFVKSGCNSSGYGPGYGWRFDAPFGADGFPDSNQIPTAQIVVEETVPDADLGITPDYDYNDFVGQFRAVEIYVDPPGNTNNSGLLAQINLTVYAQACSVEFPNQWQLNVDCDMPLGTEVQAIVQLFNNDNELKDSKQYIYYSEDGFSTPLFTPLNDALVYPAGYDSVNVNPWSFPAFVEGDYAEITLTLSEPAGTGGYDPWPYVPVMWISPDGQSAYSLEFWKEKGDQLNADGKPQAMLLPDTFTWPLEDSSEGIYIGNVYEGFDTWIEWLNSQSGYPPLYNWYDGDPYGDENPDPPGGIQPDTWEAFSMDKFQ